MKNETRIIILIKMWYILYSLLCAVVHAYVHASMRVCTCTWVWVCVCKHVPVGCRLHTFELYIFIQIILTVFSSVSVRTAIIIGMGSWPTILSRAYCYIIPINMSCETIIDIQADSTSMFLHKIITNQSKTNW